MSYIPLAMNANTSAHVNTGSGSTVTTLTQAAQVGDKLCILWPTSTRVGFGYGNTAGFALSGLTGCTSTGPVRSVYNAVDRHYFCWVTITAASWSFIATETSIQSFGGFGGYIAYYHKQTCTNSGAQAMSVTQSHIQSSDMTSNFSGNNYLQGLSKYRAGGGATPNTHAHHNIPENSGEIKYSQFEDSMRHKTATQNDTSTTSFKSDDSLSKLSSLVYTAGVSNTSTFTAGGKGGGLYHWDIRHGYAHSSSGYTALGSASNGARCSGFGDHARDNGAFFSRISATNFVTTSSSTAPAPVGFAMRLHSLENGSGFEGTGRTSTGSGSASSTVAGWHQVFIVAVDNDVAQYTMLDIDDATTTNYTNTNNDYSDIIWSSGGFTHISGREYMMMFLKWDV